MAGWSGRLFSSHMTVGGYVRDRSVVAPDFFVQQQANEQLQRELAKRKQAEAAEREQHILAKALRDTAAVINSTLDFDEVLDRILTNAGRVVPHDSANIMLVEQDRIVRVVRHNGYVERGLQTWFLELRLSIDAMPSFRWMSETSKPLVVPDTQEYSDWVYLPEVRWIRSYAGVPIQSKGQTVGFLNFDSAQPGFFSPAHAERLSAFADQAAIAIENARLFAEANHRAERMSVLNEIGQALASTLALDQLYTVIYQQVGRVLDADAFYVALYDDDRGVIHFPSNYDAGEYLPPETLPLGTGPTSHVIRTKLPFVVNQPGHPIQHGGTPFGRGDERSTRLSASAMHVPMLRGDRIVGVISVQSYRENAYGPEDLQMLEVIANQATISVENAHLFESERGQRALAEALRDTAAALSSTLSFDNVLDRILAYVQRVVPYDSVSIMLVDSESEIARVVRRQGYAEHRPEDIVLVLRFPVSELSSLRHMRETNRALVIPDTQAYPGWVDFPETRWIRSYAGAPIHSKGVVIGFLNLSSATPGFFTEAHAASLSAFADQAAQAIENAMLFEEVSAGHRQMQALSQRLVEAQESERRNIAGELHDEIGQMLTGLKLLLDTMDPLFSHDVAHRVEQAQAMVNDLIASVRKLSLDLHPAMLDDLGLHPALLWLYERYSLQTGIQVAFDHHGLDQRFLPEVEMAAFRIVQEALTNVARHAHVNQVTAEVRANQDTLRAKIEDHGIGFTRTAVSNGAFSMGLTGMRERAVSLGGRLTVESASGIGTCVTAELPIGNS